MTKALALVSGGLDSILAAKLIMDLGINVTGICFKSAFFGPDNAIRMAGQIGMYLRVVDFTAEHIIMTENPKYGYGKNMNPCIDCHALMLKFAGKIMEEEGFDFIITGEVLNQRPMSQTRQSLDIVKRESGYGTRILRPLCARNLPPTDMEKEGLVDREKLLDIKGKSRKVQMELANSMGIKDYPSPAGGCALTEPNFSRRLKDLYQNVEKFNVDDIEMLKIGRHFRLSQGAKAISTRQASELPILKDLLKDSDVVFEAEGISGSVVVLRGKYGEDEIAMSAKIAARYSKGSSLESVPVRYGMHKDMERKIINVKPARDKELEDIML